MLKIQELCTESHHGHHALGLNGDAAQCLPHHGDAQHQPVLIILLDVMRQELHRDFLAAHGQDGASGRQDLQAGGTDSRETF